MPREDNTTRIRRELLVRLGRLALEGTLADSIDGVPFDMTAEGWETMRCCVHHDRAILRLRSHALLGGDVRGMDDVRKPLSVLAEESQNSRCQDGAELGESGRFPLQVLGEACNACAKSRYVVTDACQACVARPCKVNCPKGAVTVNGRSHIDPDKCVNCGLCEKSCPFHAIVKVPVPCEEVCPTGAISKGEDGIARIDEAKCILCGKCLRACPFGAPIEQTQYLEAASWLREQARPLIALVAPATMAQFPVSSGKFMAGLYRLGFAAVAEVAEAACATAEREAAELRERMHRSEGFLATSCCPSWVLASKALGNVAGHVSHTPSPMAIAAKWARKRYPEARIVFIGPCLAKRAEARGFPGEDGRKLVDAVLSAEEIGALFTAKDIQLQALEEARAVQLAEQGSSLDLCYGRGFAQSGGVAASVQSVLENENSRIEVGSSWTIRTLVIQGLSKQVLALAALWNKQAPDADLVEVMACEGGCIGGPLAIAQAKSAAVFLQRYMSEPLPEAKVASSSEAVEKAV